MSETERASLSDPAPRCSGWTGDRWPRPCPRAVVEEVAGEWFCKPHAAGKKRKLTNDAKRREGYAAAEASNTAVLRRIQEINARLGIAARENINDRLTFKGGAGIVYSDKTVIVLIDDLEKLARSER